jgi:hypothetical protein
MHSVTNSLSLMSLNRNNRSGFNPDIKPQQIDVFALPSYKEAAKMKAESTELPSYKQFYGKETLTGAGAKNEQSSINS